jgi:hypothetical protein
MTTFITEEVEHQLTETIEKTTDTQEFTYQQLKNKQNSDTAGYLKPANLVNLAEQLNSNIVDDSSDSDFVTATISVTASREYEYQHGPLVSDTAKLQRSGSNENIIDFYKLQPQNADVDDLRSMLQPVDLNNLQHGEQFKTQECTTFDDSISKSLSKSTRKSSGPGNRDYDDNDDDEDSLVEIEESLIYEEIRPINNQNELPTSSSPSQASYFKPIETMTAEDFFSVPKESSEQPSSSLKPIDLIKARFEGSEAEASKKPAAKAASNEENTILAQIGKLPRSKVQLYDQDAKQDEETEPKKKPITQFKPSASSESEFKPPGKNRIVTKIPRDSSLGDPLEDSDDIDRSHTEKSEENSTRKRSKIRKPQIYPIEDNPIDDDFKSAGSRTESSHKSSSEEESVFKRPEKTLNQEKEDHQEASAGASEKSIKSLLNKYEKKPSKAEPNAESSNSATGKDQPDQSAESSKRVKKLPKNIVDMFNSGKKDLEPTSSKYASAKNENEANRPFKASTLVSEAGSKSKDVDYADNVFEDENKKAPHVDDELKEKENNSERVKKLSKSIISQYEKRDSPEEKSSERKSILDIKSERSDSQSSEEPKKLPKSTFHKYESSPSDSLDSRKKFFEEKQQRKSSSSSTDSDKIYSRPRSLSKPPSYESKPSAQGKFNSQAKYEERSSEDDQNDKGVRKLVDKYEKKPDKAATTRDETADDMAKYPRAKSLTEEHRLHEQTTKAPIIKNLISSLIDEKKNETSSSVSSSPANSQPNHDEKGIKKLINKYQPEASSSLLSSSTSNESPKEIVARKPEPTKNIKNILSKNSSPSSEEKSLELKTQKPDELKTNETKNNISNETIELSTKPNESEPQPAKEKGVKNLVNRYENKPYAVETTPEKPNTAAATPQEISKPSNDSASTGRLGKHLLESYEKPTSTAEIHKPKTDIIDYLENKAPISVYYTLNEPAPAQAPLIDSIPSFMKLSNEPKLEKMPLYDTNDVKKSNIKKIIQQYEKSPAEQLRQDLIEDEPTVEEKVQEYVRKLPKSLFNRYEKVEPVEQSQLLEENGDRLKGYDEQLPNLTYEEKVSLSMPNKYIPNTHVFRSAHSDLTAILHIPKHEDASRIKIENDPKMKVNLKSK